MTPEEICQQCKQAINLAPRTRPADLPPSLGIPQWHSHEHDAWKRGENIRLAMKANPKLRGNGQVQECLLAVAETVSLRRGRQPYLLNLGYRAAALYASRVAELLDDPDVAGHALDTLIKMNAGDFSTKVQPLLAAEHAWIRNLAKRYLARYGG